MLVAKGLKVENIFKLSIPTLLLVRHVSTRNDYVPEAILLPSDKDRLSVHAR